MDTMTHLQRAVITFTVKDGRGKPANIDGLPLAPSSNETIVNTLVEATGNPSEYKLTVNGVAASAEVATVVLQVDGDLGPDVNFITKSYEFTVNQDPRAAAATIEDSGAVIEDQP